MVLGPTGLILGSTQLERSLDKGISREGKINLIKCNHTVTPTTTLMRLATELKGRICSRVALT